MNASHKPVTLPESIQDRENIIEMPPRDRKMFLAMPKTFHMPTSIQSKPRYPQERIQGVVTYRRRLIVDPILSLVSAVATRLSVGSVAPSAWRTTVTLHLIRAAVSASTSWNRTSAVWHRRISLWCHRRGSLRTIALIPTASRTWSAHRRLLTGIS